MIRSAVEQDIEAIVRIWREGVSHALGKVPPSLPEESLRDFFLQRLRAIEPPFGFWVACDEAGATIGWQALFPFDNNPMTRSFVAEWSIYVAKSASGRGVGEALTRHAMQFASENALQYILGFISSENRRAVAMVEKCGWVRVGALPSTKKEPPRPDILVVAFVPPAQEGVPSG